MSNRDYTVWGDMTSDKSSENYPTMTLCEDCVGGYEIVTDEGPSNEDCEDCGAENEEEEEEEEEEKDNGTEPKMSDSE